MDVRYIYMGSGNGPSSWHRTILKGAFRIIKRKRIKATQKDISDDLKKSLVWCISFHKTLKKERTLNVYSAFEKRNDLCYR